jgi:hypothetical protein
MAQSIPKDNTNSAPPGPKSRVGIGAIASLIGVAFLLAFVLQNNQSVDLGSASASYDAIDVASTVVRTDGIEGFAC